MTSVPEDCLGTPKPSKDDGTDEIDRGRFDPNNIRWNCRSKEKEMKEFLDMKEGLNKKSRMKCIYLSSPKKFDFPRNLPAYRCRAYLHVTTIIVLLCILYENFDFKIALKLYTFTTGFNLPPLTREGVNQSCNQGIWKKTW